MCLFLIQQAEMTQSVGYSIGHVVWVHWAWLCVQGPSWLDNKPQDEERGQSGREGLFARDCFLAFTAASSCHAAKEPDAWYKPALHKHLKRSVDIQFVLPATHL